MSITKHFHLSIALGISLLLVVSLIGSHLTSLHLYDLGITSFLLAVMFAMFAPLPAYWHQKGELSLRDAALTIPWCLLLAFVVPIPFLVGARLHMPLCDTVFANIDRSLGFDVAAIAVWAAHHPVGQFINSSYGLLFPYIGVSIIVPAILGKPEAKRFLVANLVAVAIGAPCFTLLPAVGPWYSGHFAPTATQHAIQMQFLALREVRPYAFSILADGAGIVTFPSFHVIWAVFCASALWGFRFLRIPLTVLSTLIIASTMTTGWHYFVDVLGGLFIALIALVAAHRGLLDHSSCAPQMTRPSTGECVAGR